MWFVLHRWLLLKTKSQLDTSTIGRNFKKPHIFIAVLGSVVNCNQKITAVGKKTVITICQKFYCGIERKRKNIIFDIYNENIE